MGALVDHTGKVFGWLTVLGRSFEKSYKNDKKAFWLCECSCGNTTIVVGKNLANGNTKSCGCWRKFYPRNARVRHGNARHSIGGRTDEYKTWARMIARCKKGDHDKTKYYTARGIDVCTQWRCSFEQFLSDMGKRPKGTSLDRIDNNQGYQPGNCRWATAKIQTRNRSSTRSITALGVTLPLGEWCERTGIPYHLLWGRLRRGWTPEEAIYTPLK